MPATIGYEFRLPVEMESGRAGCVAHAGCDDVFRSGNCPVAPAGTRIINSTQLARAAAPTMREVRAGQESWVPTTEGNLAAHQHAST